MFLQAKAYLSVYGVSLKESILYPLCRLFGSLTIWTMLSMPSVQMMQRMTARYSNYLFAAFCSHFLVLTMLFNGLWLPLLGDRDSYGYLLWFIAAPAFSIVVAIGMVRVAGAIYSPIATLMTGGRVPSGAAEFPVKAWLTNAQLRLHLKKIRHKTLSKVT